MLQFTVMLHFTVILNFTICFYAGGHNPSLTQARHMYAGGILIYAAEMQMDAGGISFTF